MPEPIFPKIYADDEPALDEINAHNLAVIAERLGTIADRLDGIAGSAERISGHLYEAKRRMP